MRSLIVLLGLLALASSSLLVTGCGSDITCGSGTRKQGDNCIPLEEEPACGPGTRAVNGECVPVEGTGECGPGTELVGDECVPVAGTGECGPGTELVGDECVPVAGTGECSSGTELVAGQCVPIPAPPELAGFNVTVAPHGCSTLVSGAVPLDITVTALDEDGNTLTSFTGMVTVLGLGGIAVNPSTIVGFADGVGTSSVTVSGYADTAQVVVFEAADMQISGMSAPFAAVREAVTIAATGPTGPVRAGTTVAGVSITLATNACGSADDFEGPVSLRVANSLGEVVYPTRIIVSGAGPHDLSVWFDGVAAARRLSLEASLDHGGTDSFEIDLVPDLQFAGAGSVVALPTDEAEVFWEAAEGGDGGVDYEVYLATSAGVLGTLLATVTNGSLSTIISLASLSAGEIGYITVRAVDGFGDDIDQNLFQLTVIDGPVRYVDALNAAGTKNGGPGTPFVSIGAAIGDLPGTGGTIYVGAQSGSDVYAELPLDLPAGTHIIGGFTGFEDDTSTAASWVRTGSERSQLTWTGAVAAYGVSLADDTRLQGFHIPASQSLGAAGTWLRLDTSTGVEIRDCLLEGGGGFGINAMASELLVADTTIDPASGTASCVIVYGTALTVVGGQFLNCGRYSLYLTDDSVLGVWGESLFSQAGSDCVRAIDTNMTLMESEFIDCTEDAIFSSAGAVLNDVSVAIHDILVDNGGVGSDCVEVAGIAELGLTGSTFANCGRALNLTNGSAELPTSLDISVTNNQFLSPMNTGVSVDKFGIATRAVTAEILGNWFQGTDAQSLLVRIRQRDADINVLVEGNTFLDAGSNAHAAALSAYISAGESPSGGAQTLDIIGNTIVIPAGSYAGGVYGYASGTSDAEVSAVGNFVTGAQGVPAMEVRSRSSANAALEIASNTLIDNPADHQFNGQNYNSQAYTGIRAFGYASGATQLDLRHNFLDGIGSDSSGSHIFGYGVDVELRGATTALNVIDNVIRDVADDALRARLTARDAASQTGGADIDIRDNEVDGTRSDHAAGIDLVTQSYTGTIDVAVEDNQIQSTSQSGIVSRTYLNSGSVLGLADVDIAITDNEVGDVYNSAGMDINVLLGAESLGQLEVKNNVVGRARENTLSIGTNVTYHSDLWTTVAENTLGGSDNQSCITVDQRIMMVNSEIDTDVLSNWCEPSHQEGIHVTAVAANSTDVTDVEIAGNTASGTMGVLLELRNALSSDVRITDNTVEAGRDSAGINVWLQSLPGAPSVEIGHNRVLGAVTGVAIAATATTQRPQVVINNNLLQQGGIYPNGRGVHIVGDDLEGAGGGDPAASFVVEHNTMVGFDRGIAAVAGADATGATFEIRDNVIQDAATASFAISLSGASVTNEFNLVQDLDPAPNLEGDAIFISAPDASYVATNFDWATTTFEVTHGGLPTPGMRVRIAGEPFARIVLDEILGIVTVDGPPLPLYGTTQVGMLGWLPGNFLAADPNYRLAAGSPGIGTASDGTDVGAHGGIQ